MAAVFADRFNNDVPDFCRKFRQLFGRNVFYVMRRVNGGKNRNNSGKIPSKNEKRPRQLATIAVSSDIKQPTLL